MGTDPTHPLIAARNAAVLVAQARDRLMRAKESLDFLEHELKQPRQAANRGLLGACQVALPLIEDYVQGRPEVADLIRRAIAEATVEPAPFTRQQAIAEARAKAATYGSVVAAGLLSLAADWEDLDHPKPRPEPPPPLE